MLTSLRSSWIATTAPRVAPLIGDPPRRVAAECERPARRAARDPGAARRREPVRRG